MPPDPAFLGFAFFAGAASFFNPCGAAMLPAYLAHVLSQNAARPASSLSRLLAGARLAGAVSLGFLAVFASFGALAAYAGAGVLAATPWLASVVGALLVLLGALLFFDRAPALSGLHALGARLQAKGKRGVQGFFFFGAGYALASLACTLPLFAAVVLGGFLQQDPFSPLAGFLAYAGGMAASMLVLTVAAVFSAHALLARLRAPPRFLQKAAALATAAAGLYILYYQSAFTLA